MDFQELYAVDKQTNLEFFLSALLEVAPPMGVVTEDEVAYVASVLAHQALTPVFEPAGRNYTELYMLFERFVLRQEALRNLPLLESASAENLVFAGFFGKGMESRHNMGYFDDIGRFLFFQASELSLSPRKRRLYGRMSKNISIWTNTGRKLRRRLWENRFLLRLQ